MSCLSKKITPVIMLRILFLVLFLPAHLAIVLLSDLNFIPCPPGEEGLHHSKARGPGKERLRIQIVRGSEIRLTFTDSKSSSQIRDLSLAIQQPSPAPLLAGHSARVDLTLPSSIKIWLAATPHNYRAPPV